MVVASFGPAQVTEPVDLRYCFDLSLPSGTQVYAWARDGIVQATTTRTGRRAIVSATPGSVIAVAAAPPGIETAEALLLWWQEHPALAPVLAEVADDGLAVRLPSSTQWPAEALEGMPSSIMRQVLSPGFSLSTHESDESLLPPEISLSVDSSDFRGEVIVPQGGMPSVDLDLSSESHGTQVAGVVEPPVDVSAASASEEPSVLVVASDESGAPTAPGEPVLDELSVVTKYDTNAEFPLSCIAIVGQASLQEVDSHVVLAAAPGSMVVLARIPRPMATDVSALAAWHAQQPAGALTGMRVEKDGLVPDASVIRHLMQQAVSDTALSRQLVAGEGSVSWGQLVLERESILRARFEATAINARDMGPTVASTGVAPLAVRGSTGMFYAPLPAAFARARSQVRMIPDEIADAQLLWCPVGDGTLYAPVGGSYGLVSEDASVGAPAVYMGLDGLAVPLSGSQRTRLWSAPSALSTVDLGPMIARAGGAVQAVPGAAAATLGSGTSAMAERVQASGEVPSIEKPTGVDDDGPPWAYSDDGYGDSMPMDMDMPTDDSFSGEVLDAGSWAETNEESSDEMADQSEEPSGRWDTPYMSKVSIDNWMSLARAGELWASELLDTVAGPEELNRFGCLVSIGLLRNHLQISATDKARWHRLLTGPLASRVASVRIFWVDGKTYYARDLGERIHLVGPRGQIVQSFKIQKLVATSYDRPVKTCFGEAAAGPSKGSRRSGGDDAHPEAISRSEGPPPRRGARSGRRG